MFRFRKISLAVLLLALLTALLAGCSGKAAEPTTTALPEPPDPAKDYENVMEKGVLRVGVTDYAPIDFLKDGEWTGFDAELARLFAERIGVELSFVEIDWDKKTQLLDSGEIDCIWNGMTRTAELEELIDCSHPYLYSAEVIVLPRAQFSKYDSAEKSYHLLFAVEDGSSAQKTAAELSLRTVAYRGQNAAFDAVMNKQCDAAIVDGIYAMYMTAEGAEYDELQYGFPFSAEQICVGLRKGSSLTQKVNDFLILSAKVGTTRTVADRYGLRDALFE